MKLRSLLAPLLAVPVVAVLAACSSGATAGSTSAAADKPKVAVVLGGLANDGGFNQYAADAAHALEKKGEITAQIRESVTSSSDAEAAFRQYASQGYDLIIGWGLDFSNSVFTVAKELPKAHFVATGSADILDKATANVETWTYASDQQGYLTGWVAGKTGLSPIGVVDGQLAPFNETSYKALTVGLKAANPTATELEPIFTGSWEDPTLANQAAKAQIAAGAKLIVTGAEGYTSGVLSAAKAGGIATLGASSTSSSDAKAVNVGLVKLDFTPTLEEVVGHLKKGDFGTHSYTSTIANKGLIFADINAVDAAPDLPKDISAQVDELAKKLASGEVTIPAIG
ncbi:MULTISPECIES: BMP family ABC transporter substrate-binding protein [Leifsonia]|jgi:basic membrane protein A|uniref:Basic membrane protein n=3 Tax=Leifsonia TaxID=110932 RepID=U2SW77_LEIAQ|nr:MULTISPECIES: BMP family ABC transporter substrate-binding protein [Leifsonia]ERK69523.1 basic membrane protein [Leifsonia aquatica ATCC 14665]MBB2967114.1 basic membrane protein A [Leifsonia aquatica]NYK11119.1 basic membrane protein A [Leifsonia naganoensis]